jgi:hypothetical protein
MLRTNIAYELLLNTGLQRYSFMYIIHFFTNPATIINAIDLP